MSVWFHSLIHPLLSNRVKIVRPVGDIMMASLVDYSAYRQRFPTIFDWRKKKVVYSSELPLLVQLVWIPCRGLSRRWSGHCLGHPEGPPGTARAAKSHGAGKVYPHGKDHPLPASPHLDEEYRGTQYVYRRQNAFHLFHVTRNLEICCPMCTVVYLQPVNVIVDIFSAH